MSFHKAPCYERPLQDAQKESHVHGFNGEIHLAKRPVANGLSKVAKTRIMTFSDIWSDRPPAGELREIVEMDAVLGACSISHSSVLPGW
jgi:hypothetical protein